MTMDVRKLTEEYLAAFGARDRKVLKDLFHENCLLIDPGNNLHGNKNIMEFLKNLFDAHDELSFKKSSIIVDQNTSVLEFQLQLNESIFVGVDIIEWEDSKIKSLKAYLYQTNGD